MLFLISLWNCWFTLSKTAELYTALTAKLLNFQVYKSASKRKAHILKNHPGAELPPSIRKLRPAGPGEPDPMLSTHTQLTGTIATPPVCCPHCSKQYSSKVRGRLGLPGNQGPGLGKHDLRQLLGRVLWRLLLHWWGARGTVFCDQGPQYRTGRECGRTVSRISTIWEPEHSNGFLFHWSEEGLRFEYPVLVV